MNFPTGLKHILYLSFRAGGKLLFSELGHSGSQPLVKSSNSLCQRAPVAQLSI